jgi:predicted heme/steroid binding protein
MRPVRNLDFLLGSWSVERSINDAMSGDVGTFHGTATFVRDADDDSRVRFDETGVVRFGEYSGRANRHLYFAFGSDSVIDVSFADGHHFIDLDLRDDVSTDHHQCHSDGYDIMTLVRSDDLIEERWRVTGPAKDYEAVTFMTRITATSE